MGMRALPHENGVPGARVAAFVICMAQWLRSFRLLGPSWTDGEVWSRALCSGPHEATARRHGRRDLIDPRAIGSGGRNITRSPSKRTAMRSTHIIKSACLLRSLPRARAHSLTIPLSPPLPLPPLPFHLRHRTAPATCAPRFRDRGAGRRLSASYATATAHARTH